MELLIINRGVRKVVPTTALLPGKEGNLQTLAELLPMIRRDAQDVELRQFVLNLIIDCPNEFQCQVGKLFEFAKSIKYVRDPLDAERLADSWTTINENAGDCGDKSELLAAMLGTIGWPSRLLALNFYADLATHGYDHLLVQVQDETGQWVSLDPTPERADVGYEPNAPIRHVIEIWRDGPSGVGGLLEDLIGQGVQIGTQYAAGAVQQARLSSTQAQQIGRQFDSLAGQVTNLFNQIQTQAVITAEDLQAAAAAYQQLAQVAQQYGGSVEYVAEQWRSEDYKPAYEARLQQIAAAVQQNSGQSTVGSGQTGGVLSALTSQAGSNPWMWAAVGLIGLAALKEVRE